LNRHFNIGGKYHKKGGKCDAEPTKGYPELSE
jgi:hypothetical protein